MLCVLGVFRCCGVVVLCEVLVFTYFGCLLICCVCCGCGLVWVGFFTCAIWVFTCICFACSFVLLGLVVLVVVSLVCGVWWFWLLVL